MRSITLLVAALPSVLPVASQAASSYAYSEPAILAGTGSLLVYPQAINDHGEIVGFRSAYATTTGFTYKHGKLTDVTVVKPPATTFLSGVNTAGQIVGHTESGIDNVASGFLLSGHTVTTITLPNGGPLRLTGINNKGQVVGYSAGPKLSYGVISTNGHFRRLTVPGATATYPLAINDNGQVAGRYQAADGLHCFLYTDGFYATFDAPGSAPDSTYVAGLNDNGQIVGSFIDASYNSHGFVERNGHFQVLDAPGAHHATVATGINNRGVIAGYYDSRNDGEASNTIFSGYIATPHI